MSLLIKTAEPGDLEAPVLLSIPPNSNDALMMLQNGSKLVTCVGNSPIISIHNGGMEVLHGLTAQEYFGLPQATLTTPGTVMLSTSLVSTSESNAATSSTVAALYPATQVIDVSTTNRTVVKSSSSNVPNSYVSLRQDTSNVGVNRQPRAGITLDVLGNIHASLDVTTASDARLKMDLCPIEDAMSKIQAITGYTYRLKQSPEEKRHAGVLAQDVQNVLPEVVDGNEDDGLSVAYGNFTALLVEGLKELEGRVRDLETALSERVITKERGL